MIFFVMLGLLVIMISFLLLGRYIRLIKTGKCVIGEICGIDNGTSYGQGGTAHFVEVEFNKDGQDIRLVTWNHFFLSPFFEEIKLSRLRKKHIGRRVHVYYDPNRKTQVLIGEYVWKEFLLCVFLLFLGIILILAGTYKWY